MKQNRYFQKRFFIRKMEGNYHPIILIDINGISARMLLDTGAGKTLLGSEFVKDFNLTILSKIAIRTTGVGSTDDLTHKVKISKCKISKGFILKDWKLNTMSLAYINDYYESQGKLKIHGIIGSDFLNKYKAVINYQTKTVEFKIIETI